MNTITLRRALLPGAAAVLALTLAAGCGSDNGDGGDATSPVPAAGAEFNEADVAFAQGMLVHHEQALEMAEMAGTAAADPELAELASQLSATLGPQITSMTDLLTVWGEPTEMDMDMPGMSMPGMASEEEMAALSETSGAEFDRMFTQMMVSHHGGALQMCQEVETGGVNPDVRELAATVKEEQSAQLDTLETMLDRL
jgi:uncharacterized protein (DUF305 family)